MKYRLKSEKVDAIQVTFGKTYWPEWLKGRLAVQPEESVTADNCEFVKDGDYVVQEADNRIGVYSPEEFEAKYERWREPKARDDGES